MRSRLMLFMLVFACLLVVSTGCKEKTAAPDTGVVAEKPAETQGAQTTAEANETTAQEPEDGKVDLQKTPLIWKIEGENGPVYMLGTIHLGFDAEKE
ncbi:MAG: hypothetical protein VX475_18015, partial [Myxococcota bacterium]|nr:hypothetical protein [Myxococcota bacterium]